MAFKDPEREKAFLRWVEVLNAPVDSIPLLRAKVKKLKATADDLDADCERILKEEVAELEAFLSTDPEFQCRPGCGACCFFMSISSPLPGHPEGKPSGVACTNLSASWTCKLYDTDQMPEICRKFKGNKELCGINFEQAKTNIIELEKQTTTKKKEASMGKGAIRLFVPKKFETMVDNYKADLEDHITKHGIKATRVKSHYFYDSSTKTMPWSDPETVIRSSKSGPTLGFYRHDRFIPEENRSEHTFIVFCIDRGAVYGTAFLVTALFEHWEIPVIEELKDEFALRKVLEVGLKTDQPFPELEQAKNSPEKWKTEDGYKDELTVEEQTFLKDLVKGRLSKIQHEALFEQASIPFGFVYTDLSPIGKAHLWNILMDAEELGGEAMDLGIRVALQNYGKDPEADKEAVSS